MLVHLEEAKDLGQPVQGLPDLLEFVGRDLVNLQLVQQSSDVRLPPWNRHESSLAEVLIDQAVLPDRAEPSIAQEVLQFHAEVRIPHDRPLGSGFQSGHLPGAPVPPLEEVELEQWRGALAVVPCLHVSPVVGVLKRAICSGHRSLSDLDQQIPQGGSDHFQVILVHWLREARCGCCHQRHQVVLRDHVNVRIIGRVGVPTRKHATASSSPSVWRGENPSSTRVSKIWRGSESQARQ